MSFSPASPVATVIVSQDETTEVVRVETQVGTAAVGFFRLKVSRP